MRLPTYVPLAAILCFFVCGCAHSPKPMAPAIPLGEDRPGITANHDLLAEVLAAAVDAEGFVSLASLREHVTSLRAYTAVVAEVNFDLLGRYEQAAYLLNAHNAFVLLRLLEPQTSPKVSAKPPNRRIAAVTLADLPAIQGHWLPAAYADPLIRFGMAEGHTGGAPMPTEPFAGETLRAQLEVQARRFLARPANLEWVPARNQLWISRFFDLHRETYGGKAGSLAFIRQYWPGPGEAPAAPRIKFLPTHRMPIARD